jgi:putative transposase
MSILPDHLHVLIQVNPRDSVASVAQRLKGGTSRVLRREFPELAEFLWGSSLWAAGYFAETVGRVDEATITEYIRRQREPVDHQPDG